MRLISFLLIISGLLTAVGNLSANELDRSKMPEPGPAPSIELGDHYSFELENGLRVFIVENDKLPRVSFNLVLDIDPFWEGDITGYRSVTGELLKTGTISRSREELNEAIDYIGANVSTSSNGFFGTALSHNQDELLDILADITLNPAFDQDELDNIINRRKSGLAAERDEPSSIASKIRRTLIYDGHPYQEITSSETIDNITMDDCKAYYETYFRPNIGYLAVVGDIDVTAIKEKLEEYFGEWEPADVPAHQNEQPEPPASTQIAIHDRPHATQTVLNVTYPVDLKPGADDAITASVMNTLLGGGFFRLNENLRETHAYTYGSFSRLSSDREVGYFNASADVRTDVTDSSVYQILYEMRRLREEPVPERELQRVINYRTGNFAIAMEDPQTIARFALNVARFGLPEDYYQNYLVEMEQVTSEDIMNVARKYILPDNAYIVSVGVAEEFADKLSAFSPEGIVRYFDNEGNEIDPPRDIAIPEGLTAGEVIENYLDAIGGRENLKKINALSTFIGANVQGTEILIEEHKKDNNKFFQEISMAGNTMSKRVYNNGKGIAAEPGGVMGELGEEDLEETRVEAHIIEEMHYEALNVELELKGVNDINGKPAYRIEVRMPSGTTKSSYFDVETGLKVQETTVMETPQGDMNITVVYLDYVEVEGIKKGGFFNRLRSVFGGDSYVSGIMLPSEMEQSMGPQSFRFEVQERRVNHEIDSEKFNVDPES